MDIPALLSQTRLLSSVPPRALRALARQGSVSGYRGGMQVYELGGAADNLYIVLAGRLRAENAAGRCIAEIGRLETVGEVGIISGEPRSTNVYAARDSILLAIARERLLEFLKRHPDVMLRLAQVVVRRLTEAPRSGALDAARRPRSYAVVPALPDSDHRAVARALQLALTGNPHRHAIDSAAVDGMLGEGVAQVEGGDAEGRLSAYLADREAATRHLFLVTDAAASPWTRRCLRQSDRILLVIAARQQPRATAMLDALRSSGSRAPIDLVVVRNGGLSPGRVHEWKSLTGADSHYYLGLDSEPDAQRIARSLSGRAIGLVLGGGGARGFAHLGLLRALEELDVPVDVIGGSSMGAFIGALRAHGHGAAEALKITHDTFVKRNLLNDFLFPRIALIRGRKFVQQMESLFRELRIEDLPLPFYCVSTNLTRGRSEVHDDGPLGTWVATSMAIPGIAPPVAYNGELLCDGAVINSLPTDVMAALGRGPIIASDVSTEGAIGAPGIVGPDPEGLFRLKPDADDNGKRATLLSILFRTATLTNEAQVPQRAASSDVYLRMPVSSVGMFEWKKLADCERIGYEHAMRLLSHARPFLRGH